MAAIIPDEVVSEFKLMEAHPNPFNPVTTISYQVPFESKVLLEVYDINGRNIITLYDGAAGEGSHYTAWDASEYSSGIYFVKMTADGCNYSQKLMLVK